MTPQASNIYSIIEGRKNDTIGVVHAECSIPPASIKIF